MDSLYLTLMGIITFFFSFGVQFCFYLWYKFKNDDLVKKHKTVLDYTSGIVGDGVFVPLINIFAVTTMYQINAGYTDFSIWPIATVAGYFITYLFHEGQRYYKLTNWTMPTVGYWNTLGAYHSIFMFFESSFLCYVLFSFIKINSSVSNMNFKYGIFVLFLFLMSFIYDYWKPLFKKLFIKARIYSTKTLSMLR